MNCTCIPDLEAELTQQAEAGKLYRPKKASELLSVVCDNADIAFAGNMLVQRFLLEFTATWSRHDGRQVAHQYQVKALFCPLCGKATEG